MALSRPMRACSFVLVLSSASCLGPCTRPKSDEVDRASASAPRVAVAPNAPATAASASADAAQDAAAGLELGAYACTQDSWSGAAPNRQRRLDPKGAITLLADGTYRWLDDGGTGRYKFDAAEGTIAWMIGPIADKKPRRTTYRRNEKTSQIDITFSDGVEWSCGHGL